MPKHTITFKARPYVSGDGKTRIALKKKFSRSDYAGPGTMYSNSDLFPSILNRAALEANGEESTIAISDALPERITVDTSRFLHVVTLDLTGLRRFE